MEDTSVISQYIEALQAAGFSGDIHDDLATRIVNATDNSAYQLLPLAVLAPKNSDDIQHCLKLLTRPRFRALSITARGGGTGTNGQSLTEGIMLDCSKYMNRILECNIEQQWVQVQPGVVLDQLNDYLKPHGLFFAPSLSPSNRATLGGMINTDACGQGSTLYGKTSQHVLEITAVYSDGSQHTSKQHDLNTLEQFKKQSTLLGEVYRQVDNTVCRCQQTIEQQFPKLTRFMTGYDLKHVYNEARDAFNLNSILCGSEGTLAIVTECRLQLTPIPKHRRLFMIQYDDFFSALQHAKQLLPVEPAAIETIDGTLLQLAKSDTIYQTVAPFITNGNFETQGLNYIEFVADDNHTIEQKTQQLITILKSNKNIHYTIADAPDDIKQLWDLRKKSVGLLAKVEGNKKPLSGVEDTVVPPEKLADYIAEFRALLDDYGLAYGMFGHVDAGCLHVRPALDLRDDLDERIYYELSEQIARLTKKYGGLMWGEHGKGMRSQYVPMFFGDELYEELRKIKRAFDPYHQLNPGKIAAPSNSNETIVSVQSTLRAHYDKDIRKDDYEQYNKSMSCNGNGACFNYDMNAAMCPSYKVTRDRRHSPKGRAALLREWLRQKTSDVDIDFIEQVHDSMEQCLGCKACATDCPVNINIPREKSKFFEDYYQFQSYKTSDQILIRSEQIAYEQSQRAQFFNRLTSLSFTKWAHKAWLDLKDPPSVSSPNLVTLCDERRITIHNLNSLEKMAVDKKHVVLLQDSLTSFYSAELVISCMQFLRQCGFEPLLFEWFANGKPLYNFGLRNDFQALAANNAETLHQIAQMGLPIIGIDPSMTLSYQDEYVDILGPLDFEVQLIQRWLAQQELHLELLAPKKPIVLLPHCTESTQSKQNMTDWKLLFQQLGLELNIAQLGCCGMAGSYGHQAKNYENSKKLYEMSWKSHINDDHIVLATGFSCRCQMKRFSDYWPQHPLELFRSLPARHT